MASWLAGCFTLGQSEAMIQIWVKYPMILTHMFYSSSEPRWITITWSRSLGWWSNQFGQHVVNYSFIGFTPGLNFACKNTTGEEIVIHLVCSYWCIQCEQCMVSCLISYLWLLVATCLVLQWHMQLTVWCSVANAVNFTTCIWKIIFWNTNKKISWFSSKDTWLGHICGIIQAAAHNKMLADWQVAATLQPGDSW